PGPRWGCIELRTRSAPMSGEKSCNSPRFPSFSHFQPSWSIEPVRPLLWSESPPRLGNEKPPDPQPEEPVIGHAACLARLDIFEAVDLNALAEMSDMLA